MFPSTVHIFIILLTKQGACEFILVFRCPRPNSYNPPTTIMKGVLVHIFRYVIAANGRWNCSVSTNLCFQLANQGFIIFFFTNDFTEPVIVHYTIADFEEYYKYLSFLSFQFSVFSSMIIECQSMHRTVLTWSFMFRICVKKICILYIIYLYFYDKNNRN